MESEPLRVGLEFSVSPGVLFRVAQSLAINATQADAQRQQVAAQSHPSAFKASQPASQLDTKEAAGVIIIIVVIIITS